MSGKLQAALAWAARGFRVFPVAAETRGGTGQYPLGSGWTEYATSDPAKITAWWGDRDYNIGCLTNDLVVIDVDRKNGKDGLPDFFKLGLEFDTLTVRTTTGGYHCYYCGLDRPVSQNGLTPSVDVRAWHGYVLAPGSSIGGIPYTLEIDLPLATLPDEVATRLKAPRERANGPLAGFELDTAESIHSARNYLQGAPVAIEGMHGDDTTFRVACFVRDLGVSEYEAFDLMGELWNGRCAPPWPEEELSLKVRNAYQYASGIAGSKSAEALFNGVGVTLPPIVTEPAATHAFRPGRLSIHDIPPRPWVLGNLLMRRTLTVMVAPGGTGKSQLVLVVACHLAMGLDFLDLKCRVGPARSIIYSAEEDREELNRRIAAICQQYGFPFDAINRQLIVVSSDDMTFRIADPAHVRAVVEAAKDPDVAMFAVDPLVETHAANENDNVQMAQVMGVYRGVAQMTNTAGLIAHHTSRRANLSETRGDPDISRGATAIVNASRTAVGMHHATATDCERFGIAEIDQRRYFRLDNAKQNYAPFGESKWLKMESVRIMNGDEVGVPCPIDLAENRAVAADLLGRLLIAEMVSQSAGSLTLPQAVEVVQRGDPIYAQRAVTSVRYVLESFFAGGVEIDGNRLSIRRTTISGRSAVSLVLE